MNDSAKIGIGSSLSRVDGVEKVTGRAKYAAEYNVEGLLHGMAVNSRIAKGKILSCLVWST
jgi:xanthine dehydrogenase YagR molybdenum-binding subunit